MTQGITERLARASARHPWRTVGAWGVTLVVAVVVIATSLGDVLTTEGEITNNPESYRAYDLLAERLPPRPGRASYGDEIIVLHVDGRAAPASRRSTAGRAR